MQSKILYSKIAIPEVQRNLVIRERLLNLLRNNKEKMVILYGTPGYGKTVLLSHFVHLFEVPCAWYQLDEMDNDLYAFFEYLTISFSRIWPDFAFDARSCGVSPGGVSVPHQIGMEFIFQLNEYLDQPQKDGKGTALVLDDFQTIKNEDIFFFIQLLMEHTSDRLRIYLATRGSLPSFAAALLLREKVRILEMSDLAFTEDEVIKALEKITHQNIDVGISRNVYKKTEGWPAGTMFVAQYFKQNNGYAGKELDWDVISDESLIKHYIMNELYRRLPYDIQQFLVQTSVLDELSVNLCNSVLGIRDSRTILNYLLQENMFILRVGTQAGNYRYHTLFRMFLQIYVTPEKKRTILDRAAEYYIRQGILDRALDCCMQSQDEEKLEQYFIRYGQEMIGKKQLLTLSRCLEQLESRGEERPLSEEGRRMAELVRESMAENRAASDRKTQVYVRCFGPFGVSLGGERHEMSWRTRKAAELFAYLFERQGKAIRRNDLLQILWPEDYPNNAVAMLHNMLYNMRRELAPFGIQNLIEYTNREYTMKVELISSDLERIQEVCEKVEHREVEALEAQKELFFTYWGTYLDGIENTWCSLKKNYYEKRFLNGCDLLGSHLLKKGEYQDAAQIFRAGLTVDVYSDDLALKLMKCYTGNHDRKEARKLYEHICSVYQTELSIEPDQTFVEAYRDCMRCCV